MPLADEHRPLMHQFCEQFPNQRNAAWDDEVTAGNLICDQMLQYGPPGRAGFSPDQAGSVCRPCTRMLSC